MVTKEEGAAAAAAKSLQSCSTLCDSIDGSPPGSPVPGILQAITLEWVAISFFNAWKWKVNVNSFSRVWLLATPWTVAHQAPLSMGFSRQEYWSGVPLPSPFSRLMNWNYRSKGRNPKDRMGQHCQKGCRISIYVSTWGLLQIYWVPGVFSCSDYFNKMP